MLRALASKPQFLLLDEPAAGLNERESDELVGALTLVRDDFSCGLIVIEHDMRVIMQLCERIQVLDYGKTISTGTPGAGAGRSRRLDGVPRAEGGRCSRSLISVSTTAVFQRCMGSR